MGSGEASIIHVLLLSEVDELPNGLSGKEMEKLIHNKNCNFVSLICGHCVSTWILQIPDPLKSVVYPAQQVGNWLVKRKYSLTLVSELSPLHQDRKPNYSLVDYVVKQFLHTYSSTIPLGNLISHSNVMNAKTGGQ